jgi:hypothetical protein
MWGGSPRFTGVVSAATSASHSPKAVAALLRRLTVTTACAGDAKLIALRRARVRMVDSLAASCPSCTATTPSEGGYA